MDSEYKREAEEVSETARPVPGGQARGRTGWHWHVMRWHWRMTRHGCLLLLRTTAALLAGLALAAAVLVWRISSGPISLDFMTPWVQQALSDPEHGISVSVEHTMLSHEPGGATVNLVAQGVHLRHSEGGAEVVLPRIALDLSIRAGLSGSLAPTRIVLTAPQLHLTRQPDGTIHLGLGEGAGSEDLAKGVLADLDLQANQRGPLGYLKELAIRDAQLTLEDRALNVSWQARRADVTLFRSEQGLSGDAEVAILAGGEEASIHADFQYVDAERRVSGSLGIADLVPARFAAAAAPLAPLAALKLPVTGRVGFSLDAQSLHVEGARADVAIGAGRIEDAHLAQGALAVTGGVARLAYNPTTARVTIEEITLQTDGPVLSFAGEVGGIDPGFLRGASLQHLDVGGRISLRQVAVDSLTRYWPQILSPNSRSWVTTHLHDGLVESNADIHLIVDFDPGAPKPVQVDYLQGSLAFHNLTADYFPPLPPVQQIEGTGSFDRARFDLVATSGVLKGLRVGGATIQMTKLDTNDETIAIALGVRGPLRDTLQVIDTPPLRYAHAVGIDPEKAAGTADTQLTFGFPLINSLKIANLDYGAKAVLQDVAIPALANGHDLGAGDLKLELDRASFRVQGNAEIDGVPAAVSWMESLKPGDATRRYTLKARLDDVQRKHFGVDFLADYMTGIVGVDLVATTQKGSGQADLGLDLKDTALVVDRLDWSKRAGVPATAQLRLAFAGDRLTDIPQATLKGEGIDAALAIRMQPGSSEIQSIEASRLLLGKTDLSGTIQRQPQGGWAASLRGKSLDASKLLKGAGKGGEQKTPPLNIEATLERVMLGNEREVTNLALRFVDDGRHWQTVLADAVLTGGGRLSVRFGGAPGPLALRLDTNDMGAASKLLGVSDNIVGGSFVVIGKAEDHGDQRVYSGIADGQNYKVVHAPLIARVLSVASFTAVNSMLSGEGIPFDRLAAKYTFSDGKLSVTEAKALGGAIGINISQGVLDLKADTIDLSGTVAPAYTVNSLLGRIPLLGDVLAGGEGQGIFAVNFRIRGPTDEPKVSVNPLGIVAPGIVRRLFLFDAPPPGPEPGPQTPDPPAPKDAK
ncbi:MAG TPA: AsmA-like C-terminal domain-containing protein [Stellaceae bacterium]|nr:AsmA-like C-terminal domain-containing protein [Stellaceae bacterium]